MKVKLEEVLKKFEDLEYGVSFDEQIFKAERRRGVYEFEEIICNNKTKTIAKKVLNYETMNLKIGFFTYQEFQLLTELLKSWGWFDE